MQSHNKNYKIMKFSSLSFSSLVCFGVAKIFLALPFVFWREWAHKIYISQCCRFFMTKLSGGNLNDRNEARRQRHDEERLRWDIECEAITNTTIISIEIFDHRSIEALHLYLIRLSEPFIEMKVKSSNVGKKYTFSSATELNGRRKIHNTRSEWGSARKRNSKVYLTHHLIYRSVGNSIEKENDNNR